MATRTLPFRRPSTETPPISVDEIRSIRELQVAPLNRRCKRGLYFAPWMGENCELVLLAIRSDGRLNEPPFTVPWDADSIELAKALESRLDAVDAPPIRLLR